MPAPEVRLTLGGTDYADGSMYEFGSVRWGANTNASTVRGFIIHNTGDDTLTLGAPVLSGGLSLREPFTTTSLAPGGSTMILVQVATGTPGEYTGHLSFATNDSDENPYDLDVHWVVTAADLTASISTVADTTPEPGQGFLVTYRVDNVGTGANYDPNTSGSFPINTAIYLSTDSTISTADTQIGSYTIDAVGPNAFSLHSETVTMPGWVAPGGTYYIGVIADYNGRVLESDDNNNASAAVAVRIPDPNASPDLIASNLSPATTQLNPGSSVAVTFQIKNIGLGPAAASNAWIGMYDDAGTYWDFETRAIVSLGNDGIANVSTTITLPGNLAPGTYHLAAIADSTSDLTETNETNNWSNIVDLVVIASPVVTNVYDANGNRIQQFIVYGDGTSLRNGFDTAGRLDWMQEFRDAAGMSLQYYTDFDQDPASGYAWTKQVAYYAADGVTRTQQFVTYDDGTSIRQGYDSAGRLDWQQEFRNADGTSLRYYTDFDQDPGSGNAWTKQVAYFAADGVTRTQQFITYDNGTSIRQGYDALGRLDWMQEFRNNDGTSLQYVTDFDQADQFATWYRYVDAYALDGVTVIGRTYYDELGNVV